MFGGVRRVAIALAIAMWGCVQFDCVAAAAADELAMPFICAIENGEARLYPGPETRYKIFGQRDEQSFPNCVTGGHCETMMVHRFATECDGVRMSWARIAEAGRRAGVKIPARMPAGFAPISAMSGRIVLPSLTASGGGVTQVSMQDLSPDSVTEAQAPPSDVRDVPQWTTTVRADAAPVGDGVAARLGGWLGAMLAAMALATYFATRWRRSMAFEIQGDGAFDAARLRAERLWSAFAEAVDDRIGRFKSAWGGDDGGPGEHALFNASLLVQSRLADAELALAELPHGLLLREVLQVEIEQIRKRAAEADRRIRSQSQQKSANVFRALHRDLDRIARIARGASNSERQDEGDADKTPSSQAEAYRVLGLNADAPPAAIKKLVDALRMTWHPDHARDEADRKRRESRMKQINAAWDLLRDVRKAA